MVSDQTIPTGYWKAHVLASARQIFGLFEPNLSDSKNYKQRG